MKPAKPEARRRPAAASRPALALEEQLRRAQRLSMIGRLAVMAAHELSNYLTIVLGNATLLKESVERGQPDLRLLDPLVLSAERGVRMARELRSLARSSPAELQPLDLAESVRATIAMMEQMTPRRLALETAEPGPLPVCADATWLDQILVNLVLNAVDATKTGGRVRVRTGRVRTGRRRGWCYFEVKDEGGGIPARIRREVRKLFFTTKAGGRGTGIGLALASELAVKLGGELLIRSRAGKGATFRVVLPVVRAD